MPQSNGGKTVSILLAALLVGSLAGFGGGYLLWGWPKNWYDPPSVHSLPATPENELIRFGWQLVVETPRLIGKSATDPAKRFAGNDLACTQCHLNAGLKPYAAPLVSTFASFPMIVNDQVLSLAERVNGCMIRSMNGRPLPEDGREMNAFIAYMRYLGKNTPEAVRVAGMGLKSLPTAAQTPDRVRGEKLFVQLCASCHGANGLGQRRLSPEIGFAAPPLWGDESFNAAAGMSRIDIAAAFIRSNMPHHINYKDPLLTEQQAWDVAAYFTSQPRPPAPR